MSEKYLSYSCFFEESSSAEALLQSLGPVEDEINEDVDSRLENIGVRPITKSFSDSCAFESYSLSETYLKLNFFLAPEDKFPSTFVKDLSKLGAHTVIAKTTSDFSERVIYYLNGLKVKKKDFLQALETMSVEQAFMCSFALGDAQIKKYLKKLGGAEKYIAGKPAFFYLSEFIDKNSLKKCVKGVDLNLLCKVTFENVIHHLINSNNTDDGEVLDFILSSGVNVNHANKNGDTPLVLAIKHRVGIDSILDMPSLEVTKKDSELYEPIHHFCFQGSFDDIEARRITSLLVERGADLNSPSPSGSPLWISAKYSPGFYVALREANAELTPPKDAYVRPDLDALLIAVEHQDEENFEKLLLDNVKINGLNELDEIKLFRIACDRKNLSIFEVLASNLKYSPSAFSPDGLNLYCILIQGKRLNYRPKDAFSIALTLLENEDPETLRNNIILLDFEVFLRSLGASAVSLIEKAKNKGLYFNGYILSKSAISYPETQEGKRELLERLLDFGFDVTRCVTSGRIRRDYGLRDGDSLFGLRILRQVGDKIKFGLLLSVWDMCIKEENVVDGIDYLESIGFMERRIEYNSKLDFDNNVVIPTWRKVFEHSDKFNDSELELIFDRLATITPVPNLNKRLSSTISWSNFPNQKKERLLRFFAI